MNTAVTQIQQAQAQAEQVMASIMSAKGYPVEAIKGTKYDMQAGALVVPKAE